jgi:hypothetical protein
MMARQRLVKFADTPGVGNFTLPRTPPVLHSGEVKSADAMTPMSIDKFSGTGGADLVRNSSLYREFQAEREEILRHKWLESEKAGHDIGFERALADWIVKHRSKWRKARNEQLQRS